MWKHLFTPFTAPVLGNSIFIQCQAYFYQGPVKRACLCTESSFSVYRADFYEYAVNNIRNPLILLEFFIIFSLVLLLRQGCAATSVSIKVSYAQSYPQMAGVAWCRLMVRHDGSHATL